MKAIDGFDPNRDHSKMPFQFDMLFNMTSTLLDIHTVCPYVIVGIFTTA